ncbi:MerR family transcriptional regulator [Streptomyces sp. NBC_01142]|uniref:MerR family transcriptional regulator n=1 Tax=Streptomyces sp. NBC_01142 TaxID=2975865 RepID=UPI00224DA844|nr:MerR family transcriptional regulator [Streptomyces sp. NBC_01142]MCX4823977.1 MerR family transcriptional regulator [Streptomyces sp. NBC_01142]
MRIGELSRRTGVPVPTIKYYVREGLLPAGRLTSPNQASYDDAHERRLRLIRALLEVGGLKVAAVAAVLAAIDDPGRSVHKVLGAATDRIVPRYGDSAQDEELEAAREEVSELIGRRGWRVDHDNPAAEALAGALAALEGVGHGEFTGLLDDYADAAEQVAGVDIAYVGRWAGRDDVVERAVIGTVLGDAVFASLRRLAHVDVSARAFGDEGGRPAD